ncbi:hypothetical protein DSECCO2_477450 [anaerobic digester metagenome]
MPPKDGFCVALHLTPDSFAVRNPSVLENFRNNPLMIKENPKNKTTTSSISFQAIPESFKTVIQNYGRFPQLHP